MTACAWCGGPASETDTCRDCKTGLAKGFEQPILEGMPLPPQPKDKKPPPGVQYRRWFTKKKVIHCDMCVQEIHLRWGKEATHAPNDAAWKKIKGNVMYYLCFQHKEEDQQTEERWRNASKRRAV